MFFYSHYYFISIYIYRALLSTQFAVCVLFCILNLNSFSISVCRYTPGPRTVHIALLQSTTQLPLPQLVTHNYAITHFMISLGQSCWTLKPEDEDQTTLRTIKHHLQNDTL